MKLVIFKATRNSYENLFVHSFEFWITRHAVGFTFRTPNYSSGTWLNPVNAIRSYMKFCVKADEKATYNNF